MSVPIGGRATTGPTTAPPPTSTTLNRGMMKTPSDLDRKTGGQPTMIRANRYRTCAARRAVLVLTSMVLLGGCGLIMGEDLHGLTITVTNKTDYDLQVQKGGTLRGFVDAGASATVEFPRVECTPGANAVTEDKSLAALHSGDVCDGDTWVIEQDDLVPYDQVFPTPSS